MILTVLGYGTIPAILALVIVLVPLFSSVSNPAIVCDPQKREIISRQFFITICGLLIYYMGLVFLALNPDTVPILKQVIYIATSTAKYLFSYVASQSVETLILWGILIGLFGVVGYYLGRNK